MPVTFILSEGNTPLLISGETLLSKQAPTHLRLPRSICNNSADCISFKWGRITVVGCALYVSYYLVHTVHMSGSFNLTNAKKSTPQLPQVKVVISLPLPPHFPTFPFFFNFSFFL